MSEYNAAYRTATPILGSRLEEAAAREADEEHSMTCHRSNPSRWSDIENQQEAWEDFGYRPEEHNSLPA